MGLQRMTRMYFVPHSFKLANVACEEALLDSPVLQFRPSVASERSESRHGHDRACHDHCAADSTKNAGKQRDPETHQTRKGRHWYFGIKINLSVDTRTGLARNAVVTPANVHDKHPLTQSQSTTVQAQTWYWFSVALDVFVAPD